MGINVLPLGPIETVLSAPTFLLPSALRDGQKTSGTCVRYPYFAALLVTVNEKTKEGKHKLHAKTNHEKYLC